jgi:hypothetical protein
MREALRRRRPARKRRRWPWIVLLVLLLLALLLLRDCSCAEPVAVAPEVLGPPSIGAAVDVPAPAPPLARVVRRDRPAYETEPPDPLAWIDAYRLQVAARGPRLAECFVGVEQPGALKWTASVEASSGRVSDHTLEPTLESAPVTAEQRDCVLGVLSDPPYRLEAEGVRSTPSRVGIGIEF